MAIYIDRKRENERERKRDKKAKTGLRNDLFYGTADTKCLFLKKGDLFVKTD
jgi:hypothetical protein